MLTASLRSSSDSSARKVINEIFIEKGEEYFRNLETTSFEKLIAKSKEPMIIAAGGGFPLRKENQLLMSKTINIFIDTDFKTIMKSGLNIGKDIMGTMTNTLILAYIGSSLSTVLLLTASSHSISYLFNLEMIFVEILQAIVGSIGILTTIPLTSVIAASLYKYVDTSKYVYKYKGVNNK